jgi:hypothetical protein
MTDILESAKKITSFFGNDGYPITAASREGELKQKFNALLQQVKDDGIQLNAENLAEMLNIASATPGTPGTLDQQIGVIATNAADQAALMARVLNDALTNYKDSDKAETIAATLKEKGVNFKDAAAALNQQRLRLDSKYKFNALLESYPSETNINIAVALAWGGILPGATGGPAVATNAYSLSKRLKELKNTGIKLTLENLSEMLDAAGHDGTKAGPAAIGAAIKTIAPGGLINEEKLIVEVLNDCLSGEKNKHRVISDILHEKGVNLKSIIINLPEVYKTDKELKDAGGYRQLYNDAVDHNHITKDNMNKFTADLVEHRRKQGSKLRHMKKIGRTTAISKDDFVNMMVLTCRAYKEKGASDMDVQKMLKSFANQYGGFYYDDASQSNKDKILQQAANSLFKNDLQKVEKVEEIVISFNPTTSLYKKPSSVVRGAKTQTLHYGRGEGAVTGELVNGG